MRKVITKRNVIIVASIVSIIVIYSWIKGCSRKATFKYDYHKVTIGDVKKTISVSGKLELHESYLVNSKINGEVSKIYVDFNQEVKKGQLLVFIDSLAADQEFASFLETYRKAKLELENQKEFMDSKKRLLKEQLISQKEYAIAERNYKKTLASFKQAQLTYNNHLTKKKYKYVYSPVSGIVIQRWAELRKPVNAGSPLYLIAPNLKKMKLIINVDESDIGYVKAGQSVEFSVSAYPEKTFTGEIQQVRMNPINRGNIVTYESLVLCDNKEKLLRPGMTATATVNTGIRRNVLRVPNQAFVVSPIDIEVDPNKKFVWKKDKLKIGSVPMNQVEVKTGFVGDYFTEVIDKSLKKGDEVLIGIHNSLEVEDELSKYGN